MLKMSWLLVAMLVRWAAHKPCTQQAPVLLGPPAWPGAANGKSKPPPRLAAPLGPAGQAGEPAAQHLGCPAFLGAPSLAHRWSQAGLSRRPRPLNSGQALAMQQRDSSTASRLRPRQLSQSRCRPSLAAQEPRPSLCVPAARPSPGFWSPGDEPGSTRAAAPSEICQVSARGCRLREAPPARFSPAPPGLPPTGAPGAQLGGALRQRRAQVMSVAAESPYRQHKRALDRADSSPERQFACGKRLRRPSRPQAASGQAPDGKAAHVVAATARAALMGLFPDIGEQVGCAATRRPAAPGFCGWRCHKLGWPGRQVSTPLQVVSDVLSSCGDDIDVAIKRLGELRLTANCRVEQTQAHASVEETASPAATPAGAHPGSGKPDSRARQMLCRACTLPR